MLIIENILKVLHKIPNGVVKVKKDENVWELLNN